MNWPRIENKRILWTFLLLGLLLLLMVAFGLGCDNARAIQNIGNIGQAFSGLAIAILVLQLFGAMSDSANQNTLKIFEGFREARSRFDTLKKLRNEKGNVPDLVGGWLDLLVCIDTLTFRLEKTDNKVDQSATSRIQILAQEVITERDRILPTYQAPQEDKDALSTDRFLNLRKFLSQAPK